MAPNATDEKMAEAERGEPAVAVDPKTSARMAKVRGRDTTAELRIRRELHRRGRRFFVQRKLLGDRRTVDIVFPRARLAVFVDGCFWHSCPQHGTQSHTNSAWWAAKLERNAERDRHSTQDLIDAGWTVLRIWEHEDVNKAADRIEKALDYDSSHRIRS